MTRGSLVLVALAACAPDPEVAHIPVSLVDPSNPEAPTRLCADSDYELAESVVVEVRQDLASLGQCVLERACVDLAPGSVSGLADLEAALAAEGVFFDGIAPYEDVLVHVRGVPRPACEAPPPENPLFCGFSGTASIGADGASFTVALSCGLDFARCPPAPGCAGSGLE